MRTIMMALALALVAGCDETEHSSFHPDFGITAAPIGTACVSDTPPASVCGYWPQHFCSDAGACAAVCNVDGDCPSGSACVGAADLKAGDCRLSASDGGATSS
jgi:hypothetical protein